MEINGTVYDILHNKTGEIWTTSPADSVYEAIRLMGEKNIGALVAVEGDEVVGVLSERDYSRKVVLQGRTSRDTTVGEIISRPAITVRSPELPGVTADMVDDGRLVGLISIGDLVNWVMQSQMHTISQLQGYIAGDYPG